MASATHDQRDAADARQRILTTAYRLFCRHGIRSVGIEAIIEGSGVAKMTMYRHFRSKDDLVVAVLERRAELWTRSWLQTEVEHRAADPAGRLLAVFDVFGEWFHRPGFEGCFFINALLEFEDRRHRIHRESRRHLALIREFLEDLAGQAGVSDPERFARQWHILMKGSIVAAQEGDQEAAGRARQLALLLLQHELANPTPGTRRRSTTPA